MLDIRKLLEKKRKRYTKDEDYIEELERMLESTNEAYDNVELENEKLRKKLKEMEQ